MRGSRRSKESQEGFWRTCSTGAKFPAGDPPEDSPCRRLQEGAGRAVPRREKAIEEQDGRACSTATNFESENEKEKEMNPDLTCPCPVCEYSKEIHLLALRQKTAQDLKMVNDLYERFARAEDDNSLYRGRWRD